MAIYAKLINKPVCVGFGKFEFSLNLYHTCVCFCIQKYIFISNQSGEKYGPDALTISPHGHYLAFIGPQNFTVTVVSTKTLDEVRSGHRHIKSYLYLWKSKLAILLMS